MRPAERALAVVCIVALASALPQVARFFDPDASWTAIERVVWPTRLALCAAAGVCAVLQPRPPALLLRTGWPVLLPVVLACASVVWSANPLASLRAALALVGTTAVGGFLALRFPVRDQLHVVAASMGLVAAESAAAAWLLPALGVMQELHAGAWRGVVGHKNLLGQSMALMTLACVLLAISSAAPRGLALAGVAGATAVLAATRSLGAWLVTAGSLTWTLLLLASRGASAARRGGLLGGSIALAALVALGLALARDPVARLLGTDASFNERTSIWAVSLAAARERPWLGHGLDAFWTSGETREEVVRQLGFFPWHAHNGFLDLLLELGIVGVLAFGVPFAFVAARWLSRGRAEDLTQDLWPAAYLALFALSNLGESSLLRPYGVQWALYVMVVGTLAKRPDAAVSRSAIVAA